MCHMDRNLAETWQGYCDTQGDCGTENAFSLLQEMQFLQFHFGPVGIHLECPKSLFSALGQFPHLENAETRPEF